MMIGAMDRAIPYAYEIRGRGTEGRFGIARVYEVIRVDTSRPFPTRTIVSEHNSREAAERAAVAARAST